MQIPGKEEFAETVRYFARKLWREVEDEDRDAHTRWWRPTGLLLVSMTLIDLVVRSVT